MVEADLEDFPIPSWAVLHHALATRVADPVLDLVHRFLSCLGPTGLAWPTRGAEDAPRRGVFTCLVMSTSHLSIT